MKVNDIKKEALRLMFATYSDTLTHSYGEDYDNYDVDEETNEQYTQYLANMDGCISRCLKRFESVGALDLKVLSIPLPYSFLDGHHNFTSVASGHIRYPLPTDCIRVSKVSYDDGTDYVPQYRFAIEGREVVLKAQTQGQYIIQYYPRVQVQNKYVSSIDMNNLGINDNLAGLIPYFISAELYQEDEPSISAGYRNTFEAMLSDYLQMNINFTQQANVSNVWW